MLYQKIIDEKLNNFSLNSRLDFFEKLIFKKTCSIEK